jgi:hypothetical protein
LIIVEAGSEKLAQVALHGHESITRWSFGGSLRKLCTGVIIEADIEADHPHGNHWRCKDLAGRHQGIWFNRVASTQCSSLRAPCDVAIFRKAHSSGSTWSKLANRMLSSPKVLSLVGGPCLTVRLISEVYQGPA